MFGQGARAAAIMALDAAMLMEAVPVSLPDDNQWTKVEQMVIDEEPARSDEPAGMFRGCVAFTPTEAMRVQEAREIVPPNGWNYISFKKTRKAAVEALLTSRAGPRVALLQTKMLVLEVGLNDAQLGAAVMNGHIYKRERQDSFGRPGWNFYGDFPLVGVSVQWEETTQYSNEIYGPLLVNLNERYGEEWVTKLLMRTPADVFQLLVSGTILQ